MSPKIDEYYYCKKTIFSILNNENKFEKGNNYRLSYLHHAEVVMHNKNGYIIFSLSNSNIYSNFYEYFGTVKDERKDKLNKLYSNVS